MRATTHTTEESLRRLARELALERERYPSREAAVYAGSTAMAVDHTARRGERPGPAGPLSLEQAGALAAVESIDVAGAERLLALAANVGNAVDWAEAHGCPAETGSQLAELRSLAATLADHLIGVEEALGWLGSIPSCHAGLGARVTEASARAPAQMAVVERALTAAHSVEIAVAESEMRATDGAADASAAPADQSPDVAGGAEGGRVLGGCRDRAARGPVVVGREAGAGRPGATALFGWLETLVEAGQFMPFGTWYETSRNARCLLYRLLDATAPEPWLADTGADAPTVVAPDGGPAERPRGEDFLERYFARKRLKLFRQRPAVAAERLERFQQARETMLAECDAHLPLR